MKQLPDVNLPHLEDGQEVVVVSDRALALVSTNKAKTRRRYRAPGEYVPPDPPPDPPTGEPAFLSRPTSGNISISGGANVVVENKTIRSSGGRDNPVGIGITIQNVTGSITIRDVDLADLIGGIFIRNCTGTLLVENVRSRNIGDGTIGSGHSNHIQLAECSFSGFIRNNRFLGGQTEDMLSTWHSGGRGQGQELIIEGNHLQGLVTDTATTRAWKRGSGTGIILSDGAGSSKSGWIICRNNTLLTPGQVGLQIIDGPGLQVRDNIVVAEKRPGNNNPMTTWEGNPSGIATGQRYNWENEDGSHPSPWKHSNNGMVFSGNVDDRTLKASDYVVVL
jgi:hypothetical protein